MITPFVVKVNLVKLLVSSVLMSFAFLKSWRKEVDFSPVSPLEVLAKLKVVASVKAAAKSNCFILFCFMPETIPSECQLFAFVDNQRVGILLG